jgi:hypothetical protein
MARGGGGLVGFALGLAWLAGLPVPTRAAFERGAADPLVGAMAGIVSVGHVGVFSSAALPVEPSWGALVTATRPFGLPGLMEVQADGWRGGRWAWGAGMRQFGTDGYAEKEVRIVLTAGDQAVRAGIALRGLELSGAGIAAWRSFAVDAGARIRPDQDLEIGVVLDALVGEVPGDPDGRLRRTAVGVRRRLGPGLSLLIEAEGWGEAPLAGRAGVSWEPGAGLRLLAGVGERPDRVSWGLSVIRGPLDLRVAVSEKTLGRTIRFGVAWGRSPGFSPPQEKPIP